MFQIEPHGLGDRLRIGGQPAGLAEQGDQVGTDHPVHRVGEIQPQLLAEVVAQGAVITGKIVDAAVVALEAVVAAAASMRPTSGAPSPAPPGS